MKLATLLLLTLPRTAGACAVCFGKSDQVGLIAGITWGIVVLLALTFSAVAGIFAVARRIERNRAAAEALS